MQVTGRKGGRMWDKSVLDGLDVLYWPGHLVMGPGICVLEWPVSGLQQEVDQVADRKRLSYAGLRTLTAGCTAQGTGRELTGS